MWNMYSLDGPHTNDAEGWQPKIRKLAGKAHPNIYEAVELFKAEQTATEVSLMQLAAGGLPVRRRRKYREKKKLVEMGHLHFLLDEMGLDEMGLNEMALYPTDEKM